MKRRSGPHKIYKEAIQALSDFELYTPSSIANFIVDHKLFKKNNEVISDKLLVLRIRTALAKYTHTHFKVKYDGLLQLPGKCLGPAWFGWRWKQAYIHNLSSGDVTELDSQDELIVTKIHSFNIE